MDAANILQGRHCEGAQYHEKYVEAEPELLASRSRPFCMKIYAERRMSDYWVRLCIYKHTPDVLMPWESFIKSDLAKKFKDLCEQEQS